MYSLLMVASLFFLRYNVKAMKMNSSIPYSPVTAGHNTEIMWGF